ncbi:MAG: hypothetical protein AMXMBFR84_07310 [Candidatus Hydrogenedentota bacterium]
MKNQFVDTLQDGDIVNDYFIAARKDLRDQTKGGKFLGMVFRDRTGDVGGVLWNNAQNVAKLFAVGDVVQVRGTVQTYQDRMQIRVDQVLPMRDEEYDPADLVAAVQNSSEILTEFQALLGTIKNEWLRKLVDAFWADADFSAKFERAAAGKRWHHGYRGGLLQHCLELAKLADATAAVFPRIDRDLLLTSVLIHDIGKIEELSDELCVEYTTPGKLLGHLAIGYEMANRKMNAIPGFPETIRIQLLHCILSHHGSNEFGSPVVPKTLEAVALHHIDNLGAQLNAVARIVDETRGKGQAWSDYQPLIEREIWTKE